MPRALVSVGVPVDLEEQEFEYKNGDKAGQQGRSLSFKLNHPSTAMAGSVLFEARDQVVMDEIAKASASQVSVQVVGTPRSIRRETADGIRDWVKISARAVLVG